MSKRNIIFLSNIFISDCVEICSDDDESDGPDFNQSTQINANKSQSQDQDQTQNQIINSQVLDQELEEMEEDELPNLYKMNEMDEMPKPTKFIDYSLPVEFDTLPNWFYNPQQWVKSTNLLCWKCNIVCHEHPWFIPLTKARKLVPDTDDVIIEDKFIDESDAAILNSNKKCKEITVIKPYGVFCSPWCVMSRIKYENDPKVINKWQSISLLLDVYYMYTGVRLNSIPEAYYPKEIMIQYAGSKEGVTPVEYRRMNTIKAQESLNLKQ